MVHELAVAPYNLTCNGGLAQLVEQRTLNPFVASSSLASPTSLIDYRRKKSAKSCAKSKYISQ